jgi:cellulose synthase/poly-beta-1,6-N-acetylglucosamine synthase-like glycosyltransferase
MRNVALRRPWNLQTDSAYEPDVSIMMPVRNESSVIESKLDNLMDIEYPKEKMEIVVIDGGSADGTRDIVRAWSERHPNIPMKLVVDPRRGMVCAENTGLAIVSKPVLVKTDADIVLTKTGLAKLVRYLADPTVGAVAGSHRIVSKKGTGASDAEETYQKPYRWLRIGESKLGGTLLFDGEFMVMRTDLVRSLNGFDLDVGCDDAPLALKLMANGYKAISVEDEDCIETTPFTWRGRFGQKVRRARHLLEALWKYKYLMWTAKPRIRALMFLMEFYIYLVNPILFLPLVTLTGLMVLRYPAMLVLVGLFVVRRVRRLIVGHASNMMIMIDASLRELVSKAPLDWSQTEETRAPAAT